MGEKTVGLVVPATGKDNTGLPTRSHMQKQIERIRELKKELEQAHIMLREVVQYLNPEVSLSKEITEYLEEINGKRRGRKI